MRAARLVAGVTALFVLGGTTTAVAASAAQPAPATVRTIIRPVTSSGHAAPGFHAKVDKGGEVDCSFGDPSSAAVDADIVACAPDAAYAIACWKSHYPQHVLCLRDARGTQLDSIYTSQPIAQAYPYKVRAPLELRFNNGILCSQRDGGAGPSLNSHPTWVVYDYCTKGYIVWGPQNSKNWAINRSNPAWTAYLSHGTGAVHKRTIKRVWLVGTAGS